MSITRWRASGWCLGETESGAGHRIESAGIALTAVGTAPLKVEEAERLLRAKLSLPSLTQQVAELCVKQARFFTNVHLNPTARRAALRTLVRQSLTDLMAAKHKEEV